MDDIGIATLLVDIHIHIAMVHDLFTTLAAHGLHLKLSKSVFLQPQMDFPTTPITSATCRHSPSPEAPRTRRNSKDSYDNCKDPSHPLYQYNYREAYRQHILQTSKDRAAIEALEDTVLVPWNMPATLLPSLEEAVGEGSVWEAAPPEDTHCPSLPSDDDAALLPGGHHIPRGFDLNIIAPLGHSAVDQQLLC